MNAGLNLAYQSSRAAAVRPRRARAPQRIDPVSTPPMAELLAPWGPVRALRTGLLPWRRVGGRTIIASLNRRSFERHRPELTQLYGPVTHAPADRDRLHLAVQQLADEDLAARAESRTPDRYSCRNYGSGRFVMSSLLLLSALAGGLIAATQTTVIILCAFALLVSAAGTLMKLCAALATLRAPLQAPSEPFGAEAILPRFTILVPMFREHSIAEHLLANLSQLRYPRDRLELCLVVEAGDTLTRDALTKVTLPSWIRAITVPPGTCQTKPRALNYALDFTDGDIVGIYDAEDAPDPDQLLTVARHFARARGNVACLQGSLDYFNARTNWISRCFTLEYASWFRVVLPGMQRLGLVIPLGGTIKWSQKTGQLAKVYPKALKGYENGEAPELYRPV